MEMIPLFAGFQQKAGAGRQRLTRGDSHVPGAAVSGGVWGNAGMKRNHKQDYFLRLKNNPVWFPPVRGPFLTPTALASLTEEYCG